MKRKVGGVLTVLLALFSLVAAAATEYTGQVVGISDGDTLTLLTADRQQVKVRLAEIDTPESRQPYGQRAKQALSNLAFNQQARVVVQDTDRYGRTVGRVYVADIDVNAEMIRQGAAWVYRQYAKDQSLFELEAEAKAAGRGLWGLPEAQQVPPWEWRRRGNANSSQTSVVTTNASGNPTCGNKRYCREMASCEEAKFYLTQCSVRSLDRDKDGVPCESLCR